MSYRIDPDAPLADEIRRIAGEELSAALDRLAAADSDPDKAVHECRQRMKRIRALIALVRPGSEDFAKTENARYCEAARGLAAHREAGALIETIARLSEAFPKKKQTLDAAREALLADRDRVMAEGFDRAVAEAAAACAAGLQRLGDLTLTDDPELVADILAKGAAKTLRRARSALRDAEREGVAESFHDLRKATKAHAMHLALLRDFWPSGAKKRRKRIASLGDKLGELHDILILRQRLLDGDPPWDGFEEADRIDTLCARVEKKLRRACVKDASRLFEEKPKQVARKITRKARQQTEAA